MVEHFEASIKILQECIAMLTRMRVFSTCQIEHWDQTEVLTAAC